MGQPQMREFRPLPAELEIEIVRTPASLGDHAKLLSEGFGFPREVADQIIRPALLEQPRVTVVVGRVDGEPVSTALSAVTDATAGVYNVATPERFRGKGYGEAMTAAAIA